MCFDLDSHPPIAPIAGGALDSEDLVLTAPDGNRLRAFTARAATPTGAGMLILPDVRGLHPFYEELALRFAEAGIDALAIDYFGRTEGTGSRGEGFEFMPHVQQTTWDGLVADAAAGAAALRASGRDVRAVFSVGFCFGGRVSFLMATRPELDLAGVIGFYGIPVGAGRAGMPAPADVADQFRCPVLGLFGGADGAIPPESVAAFDTALTRAGVEHELISYPGAPHSFFDRKQAEFADASSDAWQQVLAFVRKHTPAAA
jgi:carboxymethylenebutenolidase